MLYAFIITVMLSTDVQNLSLSNSVVIEGSPGSKYVFNLKTAPYHFIRIHFNERSAKIIAQIQNPPGTVVARIKRRDASSYPFILSFMTNEGGDYQLNVEIIDLSSNENINKASSGEFSITWIDDLSMQELEKREKNFKENPMTIYLKENAIPISDINPINNDLSDLTPIKNKIGKARVVILGEQSHFERETQYGKLKLLKFLHEEMGFDVLAFESDLYSTNRYQLLLDKDDPKSELDWNHILYPWVQFNEFHPIMDYVKNTRDTPSPIAVAGFDTQLYEDWSQEFLIPELVSVIKSKALSMPSKSYFEILSNCLKREYVFKKHPPPSLEDAAFVLETSQNLEEKFRDLAEKSEDFQASFWAQVMESSLTFLPLQLKAPEEARLLLAAQRTARSAQMGKNILWLANQKYKNRKIVVWCASFHGSYEFQSVKIPGSNTPIPSKKLMGEIVRTAMGDQVYSIFTTSYKGTYGNIGPGRDLEQYQSEILQDQDPELELEEMLFYAGFEYAFLDMSSAPKGSWLHAPFLARPLGHICNLAPWSKMTDAFLFVREVSNVTTVPEQ